MAVPSITSGRRRANISYRPEVKRWRRRLMALDNTCLRAKATRAADAGDALTELLSDLYGCLATLIRTPAPNLPALRLKIELAYTMIFAHDPTLKPLFEAMVEDVQRLVFPTGFSRHRSEIHAIIRTMCVREDEA